MSTDSTIYASNPATDKAQAMVNAAKAIMAGLYSINTNYPDFEPNHYTANNNTKSNTSYEWHDQNNNTVNYPASNSLQAFEWASEPYTKNKHPRGKITAAASTQAVSCQAVTDCSGFVTSMLANSSILQGQSIDLSFKEGAQLGFNVGNDVPFAGDYLSLIQNKRSNISNPILSDLSAGDIISLGQSATNKTDTGHIMVVMAVAMPAADTSSQRTVVVIDCTGQVHANDTREAEGIAGVGMGEVKLAEDDEGNLTFYWKSTDSSPNVRPVALGRLN